MYIKQISIQGFKSYRDQTIVEPFSPKHNVVVGRNGSGKSNFFLAIRFVLSDMFSNMRTEDRQSLLHEGAGLAVMSAYVEIVFDNSDNRFPIDKEEVVLRRTIGLKKDEYYLDKKHVTKADVQNLLESAGFSRSNPYYIVQQGKITSLATMRDADRLDLLKEVAGTHVYDEKRDESLKILQETEGRRKKIEEVIGYIEERLKELEAEKEELREYQKLDKERRAVEYTIYDRELKDAREHISQIDESRGREGEKNQDLYAKAEKLRETWKAAEKELKAITTQLQRLNKDKDSLEKSKTEHVRERAKLELDVKDLEDKLAAVTDEKAVLEESLRDVGKQIDETEAKLETARPGYQRVFDKERNTADKIAETERKLEELYAKQGRSSQFKSKDERDKWVKGEIKQIDDALATQRKQLEALSSEKEKLEGQISEMETDVQDRQRDDEKKKTILEKSEKALKEMKQRRDEQQNERKELWKKEGEVDDQIKRASDELHKSERQLSNMIPRNLASGLQAVKKIVEEKKIDGVHGPLIDLVDVDDKFVTAAEVTAGNSLFQVVVDTDDVAARILDELTRLKAGRVTFMPLNRLHVKERDLPRTEDVLPLIDKLKYSPVFRKAMLQVFGKTLVARNLEVGNKYAREYNLDCITMDGDKVEKRGALVGGFNDVKRSRIELSKSIHRLRDQLKDLHDQHSKVKTTQQDLDQRISQVIGEISKEETKRLHLRDSQQQSRGDLDNFDKLLRQNRTALESKEKLVKELESGVKQLEEKRASLTKELGTDIMAKLTKAERDSISALNTSLTALKKELVELQRQRSEAEVEKTALEVQLDTNLRKRQVELRARLSSIELHEREELLERKKYDLKRTEDTARQAIAALREVETKVDELSDKSKQLKELCEQKKSEEHETVQSIQDEQKSMEKLINKRAILQHKVDQSIKNIAELGALPSDVGRFANVSMKELVKTLGRCNEGLKKYSHVNKKALDQYVSFTDQHADLINRKKELDTSAQAIENLIKTLDQRKDEAIDRTFKSVAKNFSDVFAELVPSGKATLVMQRKRKADKAPDADEDEAAGADVEAAGPSSAILQYSGVSMKISFTGVGEQHLLQQLSGGQKSLVALTLIFAIQRCDPAPFYLFDEIDANLDAQYRTAVANMIERQSDQAQFITTTFRPEFVEVADKHYLVSYRNRVSHVNVVTKQHALNLIFAELATA